MWPRWPAQPALARPHWGQGEQVRTGLFGKLPGVPAAGWAGRSSATVNIALGPHGGVESTGDEPVSFLFQVKQELALPPQATSPLCTRRPELCPLACSRTPAPHTVGPQTLPRFLLCIFSFAAQAAEMARKRQKWTSCLFMALQGGSRLELDAPRKCDTMFVWSRCPSGGWRTGKAGQCCDQLLRGPRV